MSIIKLATKESHTLVIYNDEQPDSPRSWDNIGHLCLFNSYRKYGDDHDYASYPALHACALENNWLIKPVYVFDHSGLSFATSDFGDKWDSGLCGLIYATPEDIIREYGSDTPENRKLAASVLESEIEALDMYARGDVYGFILYDFDTEIDSCWGFYGSDGINQIIDENNFNNYEFKTDIDNLDKYFESVFNKTVTWSLKETDTKTDE